MAGTCCAITAARTGLSVVLMQDRPVLGGNGSSEVRLWTLGATCHMGSNNRWAREGGVIDEILIENLWRNPEGNSLIFDSILLEKVSELPSIRLLLNTAAFEVRKDSDDADRIAAVTGFCSQNSTLYECRAPLFCDASGDGIVGFLSGAAFRMGAESKDEFNEPFAPNGEFGALLGHSMYFYSKDAGHPVKFVAPSFAMLNIPECVPRYRNLNTKEHGCRLWWIEWGGRLDTVHDTETIKWELWRIVYGVWDYIKNSGKFPEAENLTLEWVSHIPGKRESRRFEGPYMLSQHDVVHRPQHEDAVAYGGWSIDLHPSDGVFSQLNGSHHLHSKGPYPIPFRCYYSRNIKNLFLGGRIISSSHVAFGSTRVMGTGAHGGQAVGVAAALCRRWNCLPSDISADPAKVKVLQRELMRTGQHIWGLALIDDEDDLARTATVSASSELSLDQLPPDGDLWSVEERTVAQLLPVAAGPMPSVTLTLAVDEETDAEFELHTTSRADHHTPDVLLSRLTRRVRKGADVEVPLNFGVVIDAPRCVFICLRKNPHLAIRCTQQRITGLVSLHHHRDELTSQVGGEDYMVYSPKRRPQGQNFAMRLDPPLAIFGAAHVTHGVFRPTHQPNAWVASPSDPTPRLTLSWLTPQSMRRIDLFFDVDFDHAVESVLIQHPERAMPFCVKRYRLVTGDGRVLHECAENHQARNAITLPEPVNTSQLHVEILEMNDGNVPPAVFGVRCYA